MPEKLMFRLLRPLGRDSASPGARQIRGGWRSRLCRKRRCFVRDPGTVCGCRGPRTAVPEGGGEHCSPTHPSPHTRAHACTRTRHSRPRSHGCAGLVPTSPGGSPGRAPRACLFLAAVLPCSSGSRPSRAGAATAQSSTPAVPAVPTPHPRLPGFQTLPVRWVALAWATFIRE